MTRHASAESFGCLNRPLEAESSWNSTVIVGNREITILRPTSSLSVIWLLCMQSEGASRDILLLDISLDNYFRVCIERADKGQMSGDDLIGLVSLVLRNSVIGNESRDLQQVNFEFVLDQRFRNWFAEEITSTSQVILSQCSPKKWPWMPCRPELHDIDCQAFWIGLL